MKNKPQKSQNSPSNISPKKKYKKYSYSIKRQVVHEVQSGRRSIEDARVFYKINSKSVIYAWIKLYGKLIYDPKKSYLMKKSPQQKIKELEQKLEMLELEKDILLDITEAYEEEGVDVKKYLPELLKKDYENHKRKGR